MDANKMLDLFLILFRAFKDIDEKKLNVIQTYTHSSLKLSVIIMKHKIEKNTFIVLHNKYIWHNILMAMFMKLLPEKVSLGIDRKMAVTHC